MELLSPEGLRMDGRRAAELRRLACRLGQARGADGSAALQMGNTRVSAGVYGPREPAQRPRGDPHLGKVRVELAFMPFSTSERRKRTRGDKRSAEMAAVLKELVEATVLLELLPRSEVVVCVQVLQADGGVLPAVVNATVLALADAGIPLRALVAACAAGSIDGSPVLDMNHAEEIQIGSGVAAAVRTHDAKVLCLQTESVYQLDAFEELLRSAAAGCAAVADFMRRELKGQTAALAEKMGLT